MALGSGLSRIAQWADHPGSASGAIVVGIDGSPAARAALAWAAEHARYVGSPLLAVSAWSLPADVEGPVSPEIERYVRTRLVETLGEVVGDADVTVLAGVLRGQADAALVELSASASLLVVGCQGQGNGEPTQRLLGDVTERVVTHAHCPVVVVRANARWK
jgi:nucleotide-binding universal stress UspA family protein